MLLAIDIGNTQTVAGLFSGEELVGHWRLHTDKDRTSDETRLWLRSLLEMEGFSGGQLEGVVVSSVVPSVTARSRAVGSRMTGGEVVVSSRGQDRDADLDRQSKGGRRRPGGELGGRHQTLRPPVISVDFGTSTNFDVVGTGRVPRRGHSPRPRVRPTP